MLVSLKVLTTGYRGRFGITILPCILKSSNRFSTQDSWVRLAWQLSGSPFSQSCLMGELPGSGTLTSQFAHQAGRRALKLCRDLRSN